MYYYYYCLLFFILEELFMLPGTVFAKSRLLLYMCELLSSVDKYMYAYNMHTSYILYNIYIQYDIYI